MRGKDVGESKGSEETTSYITKSKLAKFMERTAFKGYTNPPDDFYSVFDRLFAKLDEEEEMEEDVSKNHVKAPMFGDAFASK